jgi:hypothetical protein
LSSFMWMFEAGTPAGERYHAYKHIDTGRYVHLDLGGNALAYALRPWWEDLQASPEEVVAAWTAIERARRSADRRPRDLDDE